MIRKLARTCLHLRAFPIQVELPERSESAAKQRDGAGDRSCLIGNRSGALSVQVELPERSESAAKQRDGAGDRSHLIGNRSKQRSNPPKNPLYGHSRRPRARRRCDRRLSAPLSSRKTHPIRYDSRHVDTFGNPAFGRSFRRPIFSSPDLLAARPFAVLMNFSSSLRFSKPVFLAPRPRDRGVRRWAHLIRKDTVADERQRHLRGT